ncbi:DUF2927 domain-containing protein [Roseicitreum antarcticum]|uniref:DUF2927 domain-containing protein n=1 Tax=Roseicitreum antarcticum TaxID=564137 RepID=UPI001CC21143|nr:DUF2927 domain-containing protein [Roseicitreum antarcticum]
MSERMAASAMPLPALPRFGPPDPLPPARANADMVRDILEMGFFLESGRAVPALSRFDGPVTLRVTGAPPVGALTDTDRLIQRLRSEADIDITRVPEDQPARINVTFLPRARIRSLVPQAACFLVPNVSSWQDFRANRRNPALDWAQVSVRQEVGIFIPSDTTPQETRDCLHEEVGQALGPLNDLFRLTDSIFNDDNFQTALTGFDMLVLRAWNDPALQNGMRPAQVAAVLPAVLARLNPRGERGGTGPAGPTPRAWINAIEAAFGGEGGRDMRLDAASRALTLANAAGWQDGRLALSLFLVARFLPPQEGEAALAALIRAGAIYRDLPGAEVHAAHVDMQLTVQALASGQMDLVMQLTTRAIPVARRTENAALLSSLQLLRAEALQAMGARADAAALRLDSLIWARYGFGTDDAVRARLAEVAALTRALPVSR